MALVCQCLVDATAQEQSIARMRNLDTRISSGVAGSDEIERCEGRPGAGLTKGDELEMRWGSSTEKDAGERSAVKAVVVVAAAASEGRR